MFTGRCPGCINAQALSCKKVHRWYYCRFDDAPIMGAEHGGRRGGAVRIHTGLRIEVEPGARQAEDRIALEMGMAESAIETVPVDTDTKFLPVSWMLSGELISAVTIRQGGTIADIVRILLADHLVDVSNRRVSLWHETAGQQPAEMQLSAPVWQLDPPELKLCLLSQERPNKRSNQEIRERRAALRQGRRGPADHDDA